MSAIGTEPNSVLSVQCSKLEKFITGDATYTEFTKVSNMVVLRLHHNTHMFLSLLVKLAKNSVIPMDSTLMGPLDIQAKVK